MVPSHDPPLLKLNKLASSFLIQCVAYGGKGILGPPPKLNKVKFSKGGIDATSITWLNLKYPMWRPKPKPKKC